MTSAADSRPIRRLAAVDRLDAAVRAGEPDLAWSWTEGRGPVRSRMTNNDVATEGWVSPRTVALHLRNVFMKAGITSRGQLARIHLV